MTDTFATPDDDEVLQQDVDTPVDVTIKGVVRTQELPGRIGSAKTISCDAGGQQILNRDERRKSAIVLSLDQDIRIGNGQYDVANLDTAGTIWPAMVPLPITSSDEWWVASAASGNTTRVTVIIEQWAN